MPEGSTQSTAIKTNTRLITVDVVATDSHGNVVRGLNVKWDDRFHKITIKTPKRGIQLAYRRGYIATSDKALPQPVIPGSDRAFGAQQKRKGQGNGRYLLR